MAARPTWKGYLKISLVNIPVRVFPATDSAATISFNQLHAECQTRIQQKRWCPKCEREVPISEVAKGFEFEKGRYVVMDDEDMAKVRPESTRVIDLVQFTDAAAIDPIYFERPYYLAPDGQMACESFAVIREGMKGKAGIGKLALYGREYLVAVQPKDKGLMMYTMRRSAEIRSMSTIEELEGVPAKVKPDEIKLAKQVISNFEGELDLADYKDAYQEELQRIIDAKIAGEDVVASEEQAPPKVVNLMDALRQSLDRVSTGKKKAAKVLGRRSLGESGRRAGARREGRRPCQEARARLTPGELIEDLLADVAGRRPRPGADGEGRGVAAAHAHAPAIGLTVGGDRQRRIADAELAQSLLRNPFQIQRLHGITRLYQLGSEVGQSTFAAAPLRWTLRGACPTKLTF